MNRKNETSLDIKNELNKNLNKVSLKSDASIELRLYFGSFFALITEFYYCYCLT